jgi:TolA-binding protein
MGTLRDAIISEKSLVPISLALTASFFAFWISGLSKDVESSASAAARAETKINEVYSSRSSMDAELLTQIRSQNVDINEIHRMQAILNTQMTMVLKALERDIKARENE